MKYYSNEPNKKMMGLRLSAGLLLEERCTEEDNLRYNNLLKQGENLPEGVYQYMSYGEPTNEFCRIIKSYNNEEEKMEFIALKRLILLRTMKNCLVVITVFFVVLCIYTMVW